MFVVVVFPSQPIEDACCFDMYGFVLIIRFVERALEIFRSLIEFNPLDELIIKQLIHVE